LLTVWGSSATDVWAAGYSGGLYHYSGGPLSSWASVATGTTNNLFRIVGTSAADIWVTSDSQTVLHFNGSSWSQSSVGGYNFAAWAAGPNDLFIGGSPGGGNHYDGSWSSHPIGSTQGIHAMWGFGSTAELWAVGADSNTLFRAKP
jgi:hypothetical protein